MEVFSCILKRALQGGVLEGFLASGRGGEGVTVSRLLFADDTLVFCDASKEHVKVLSSVFMWFEVVSGLKINLDKNELIPMVVVPNFSSWPLFDFINWLGCK